MIKHELNVIVKNQFGINKDVTIGGGYSLELESEYITQYRFIDKEINMLYQAGFQSVQCCDIYPPEANRWDNTHFYALVAE